MTVQLLQLSFVYFFLSFVASFFGKSLIKDIYLSFLNVSISSILMVGIFKLSWISCAIYFTLVLCQYVLMVYLSKKESWVASLAVLFPVIVLISIKANSHWELLGISYMTFRLLLVNFEYSGGQVEKPNCFRFLAYSFFPLTLNVGPINPYKNFQLSLDKANAIHFQKEFFPGLYRIAEGIFLFSVLAPLVERVGLISLWKDGYFLTPLGFIVGAIASYLYLYLNFSGICHCVIGFSRLIGVEVKENFINPLWARNISDYWNRWHISMSHFMRDLFFTPLIFTLFRRFPKVPQVHLVSIAIFMTFILVGVWHGVGTNFLILGVLHGLGLVTFNYYSHFIKGRSKEFRKAYKKSLVAERVSIAITFIYVTFVSVFFIADLETLDKIWKSILW